nr:hypothetical protein 8 [bacterium]
MTVIKIKNSTVSGRVPTSTQIQTAELALNLRDKKLYSKDDNGEIFEIGAAGDIPSGDTPPTSGNNVGDLFYDTAKELLLFWNGDDWEEVKVDSTTLWDEDKDNGKLYPRTLTNDVQVGGTAADPNISLNASDGSALFDGNVFVGSASGSSEGYHRMYSIGSSAHFFNSNDVQQYVNIIRSNVGGNAKTVWTVKTDGTTFIGGSIDAIKSAEPNISLNADGSAEFAADEIQIADTGALGVGGANYGTPGQVLVSNGASTAPSWESLTSPVFGWNHNDDTYGLYLPGTSIKVSDLPDTVDIDVQSRMRRCVINDSGVVQYYLDADNSDLKAGDWLRIVETEALNTAYTGTISENNNSLLRTGVPAWSADTFTIGQRVTHDGSVWECIAATTTATPTAGTVASDLTGTDGQVVVEVPAFSVRYGFLNGVHTREVRLGCNDSLIAQGFQPHSAFIKTDGTYKDAFYIGAYHTFNDAGTAASVSGQINTRDQTRAAFRSQSENRGTGWHVLSYLELAAIQTLFVCEFQDYNSQKVIGNGSDSGTVYGVTTGQSDGDGNHSVNSTGNADDADNYMAYRGIENLYGRAWQLVDGINVYDRVVYLTNDQTAFDDDTTDGYEFYAEVPSGLFSYQKELHALPDVFLPSVVTGASSTTYLGDAFWSNTGWRVPTVGGGSNADAQIGAFYLNLYADASGASGTNISARLAYAAN